MTKTTKLGAHGPEVGRIGLGCMAMSGIYGQTDDADSIRAIQAALELGINLIDTGDFYGMGHNEMLVAKALSGRRDRAIISVKFGAMRGPDNSWGGVDTRPAALKNFCAYSLKRLGVDVIDIYRPARLDPAVPIEDTVGAIADLVKGGYVRYIGLSEVGSETIKRAAAVHPIVDVQLEYAIATRGPEATVFPTLAQLGISATLYGVFSRGLLTGGKTTGNGDLRGHMPRFAGAAGATNADVVGRFAAFGKQRDMTPAQLAIAYVLGKQPTLVPLVGAKTEAHLRDALGALDKPLSAADITALEAVVPPDAIAGTRYAPAQMAHLDSERG